MCFVVGFMGERNNRIFRGIERVVRYLVHVRFDVSLWALVANLFCYYSLGLIFLIGAPFLKISSFCGLFFSTPIVFFLNESWSFI